MSRVELIDYMGDDLRVVNAARVSHANWHEEFDDKKDSKFIKFLGREGHTCYDGDTEVLTEEGWLTWYKYVGEWLRNNFINLAVVNLDGSFKGFERPSRVVEEDYYGDMYHFNTRDVDLLVTPNHKLYCSRSNTQDKRNNPVFELLAAKDVAEKPIRMRKATLEKEYTEIDPYYSFIGFFIGDGSIGSKHRVIFRLKKKRKLEYLKRICEEFNLNYKVTITKNDVSRFSIEWEEAKSFFSDFYNEYGHKTFPSWVMSLRGNQFRGLLDGLLNSDGSKKRSTYTYSTTSKSLAEKIQGLCSINGVVCSLNTNGYLYTLNINSRSTRPKFNDNADNKVKKISYAGRVYCATVSTGVLVVRRNNKVVLSGNSPFRHCVASFRIRAPFFVLRQWMRYNVGCAWNEQSGRYVEFEKDPFQPIFRSKANVKQGSGEPVSMYAQNQAIVEYELAVNQAYNSYQKLLDMGICKEQARMVLPLAQQTQLIWTASLQCICHFLNQRLAHDAQKEIQEYAQEVYDIVKEIWPHAVQALVKS